MRGKIVDKNGNVLAQTNVAPDGTERENIHMGISSHVVGYSVQGKTIRSGRKL